MQNKCIGFCLSLDKMDHIQGRSDSTSSVACEVLIINCQTYFIIFFQFQTFDIKFWFSVKVYPPETEKNGCYGRVSLASGLKRTWENDDLLSWRHKYIFEVPHLVVKDTKIQIPNKRYRTCTVCIFYSTAFNKIVYILHFYDR